MKTLEYIFANALCFDLLNKENCGAKIQKSTIEVMIEGYKDIRKVMNKNSVIIPNYRLNKKKNTNNYTIPWQIALKNVIWSICECKAD